MNKFHQHLNTETAQWRLSSDEKASMRGAIEAYIETHPLGAMQSPWSWVAFARTPQFLVALLVLGLSTGTAYAAQNALPGDVLYPVKIHINEAIGETLAISDSAKASWNAKAAEERIKEAQSLAASGKLDEETTAQLAADYDKHATLASAYARKLEADPEVSAKVGADLSTLQAQVKVLLALADRDGSGRTEGNAQTLAEHTQTIASANVQAKTMAFAAPTAHEDARSMQTLSIAADSGASVDADAVAKVKEQALDVLEDVRERFESISTLDASSSAALSARIEHVQALIDAGERATDPAESLADYTSALSEGSVLKTFFEATSKFRGNILRSLLDMDDDPDHRGSRHEDSSQSDDTPSQTSVQADTVVSTQTERWDPLESTCRHASLSIL